MIPKELGLNVIGDIVLGFVCSPRTPEHSWQIATFIDEHTCPPRRDNKHVTARRTAAKYEKFIMANPGWNFP